MRDAFHSHISPRLPPNILSPFPGALGEQRPEWHFGAVCVHLSSPGRVSPFPDLCRPRRFQPCSRPTPPAVVTLPGAPPSPGATAGPLPPTPASSRSSDYRSLDASRQRPPWSVWELFSLRGEHRDKPHFAVIVVLTFIKLGDHWKIS